MLVNVNLSFGQLSLGLREAIDRELCSAPAYTLRHAASCDPIMRALTRQTGVYILYHENRVFYVGRSVEELIKRLRKHAKNLVDYEITCHIIVITSDDMVLAAEEILIKRFSPVLNGTDFGSNSDRARDAVEDRPNKRHWRPIFEKWCINNLAEC